MTDPLRRRRYVDKLSQMPHQHLGELLVSERLIDEAQLYNALDVQRLKHPQRRLGDLLVELGYVDEEHMAQCLSRMGLTALTSVDVRADIDSDSPAAEAPVNTLRALLERMVSLEASDLHLVAGGTPQVRMKGRLHEAPGPQLDANMVKRLVYSILTSTEIEQFEATKELDVSFGIQGLSRFRVNVHQQRDSVAAVFRQVPFSVPTLEELNLPGSLGQLTAARHGLIVICGPQGSGKTSTLAAMLNELNHRHARHVVSIEEPIEFLHARRRSTFTQRQIGRDTHSYGSALRQVLRQDPDVVVIGELRDPDVVPMVLQLAKSGRLVVTTMQAADCVQALMTLVNVFPDHRQAQARVELSLSLVGVIGQELLPAHGGDGQIPAIEVL